MTTKADKSENTQKRIIAVARLIFARDGFAAASLSEIVEKAGITTGAVYHHFGGKKGLFVAVAEDLEQLILEEVIASAPRSDSPWNDFEAGIVATLEICARLDIQRIVFQDAPTVVGSAEWRKIEIQYAYGLMRNTIAALTDAKILNSDDPDLTAKILLGAIIEAAHSVAFSDDPVATLDHGKAILRKIVRAFRTSRPNL